MRALGVQDLKARRPVTSESLFRIASMSKAFTGLAILKLRDEGKLSLDALAETYVPEMRGWRYPTAIPRAFESATSQPFGRPRHRRSLGATGSR
jgi:CubicO group peptidase (beta-lactamase class C family)